MNSLLKFALSVLFIIAAAYGAITLVGIWNPAAAVTEETVIVDTPIEKTWEILTDPSKYPEWFDKVILADKQTNPEKRTFWRFNLKNGEKIVFEQIHIDAPRSLTLIQLFQGNPSIVFQVMFGLATENGKTKVTLREDRLIRSPFARGLDKLKGSAATVPGIPYSLARALEVRASMMKAGN